MAMRPPLGIARRGPTSRIARLESIADEREMIEARVRQQRAELGRDALRDRGLSVTVGDEEHALHAALRSSSGTSAKSASVKRRRGGIVLQSAARYETPVWAGVHDRHVPGILGLRQRVVAVTAEDEVDARNACREPPVEREARRATARLERSPSGTRLAYGATALAGSRKRQPKRRSQRAARAILHDQQSEHVHANALAAVARRVDLRATARTAARGPSCLGRFVQTSGWRIRAARARSSGKR